ncbi:leucine-rich repeat domain-containing protein [Gimesia fumaroli]|uniref:Internalin-A n=1 Tax=Gimesia fumaroli TaxID=2527976 RepID=A0A518IAI9_9PLAN|nr:hypothetical protein [Gimesia fumaroli]QDV50059.1 Internalin-A precursor [Gimesia fumaroli]
MHFSIPFLLICLLSLAGCSESQLPQQSASLSTEENENRGFSSVPADYGKRKPDESDLNYLLRKGVYPIPPEKGGGYRFDDTFETCPEEDLPLLSQVEGLRSFWIGNGPFSPAGWKQIGQISGLETLRARSSYITDEHIIGLKGLTHLKDLQIFRIWDRKSQISDKGLEVLAELPGLRRLVLHSSELNPRACELIGNCTQLRVLELRGPLTNECLKPLGKLKNLKYLMLEGTFSDTGLKHLAELNQLERLVIHSDQMTGSGLSHFTNFSELRELGFSGSSEASATLKYLNQLPALAILNLASPTVNDALLMTLPNLPGLEALSLRGSSITDTGLEALVQVKNLTELDLKFTNISNAGLTRLEPLQQLRLLLLGNPAHSDFITGNGLAPLTKLPHLEMLDMGHINSEKLDLQPLAQIKSLREVDLTFGSPDVSKRWQDVLVQRPNLKKVEEMFPVSRRVGEFGVHMKEIP